MAGRIEKYEDEDLNYLYSKARKIGRLPSEDDEMKFLEIVGRWDSDNKSIDEARLFAFRELYGA